jgi:anthranilate 1,2-dioxygenase (deaminating, decarboxylating) large subunit
MKRQLCIASATCLVLTLLLGSSAWAYEQPLGLNLGFTSFMDGAPPAGPGFYIAEYIAYRHANRLNNIPGGDDPGLNVWVNLNQFLYQSNTPIFFGGKWGIDVIVPFASIDSDLVPGDNDGMGDLLVGPYLQWDPIMGKNGPIFMHRVELQTIWPTGRYTEEKVLNPGSNHFSFDPYWAATYFITPRWTVDWRAHYLWNADNDDPFVGYGVNEIKVGQAVHANFSSSYELLPKQLRVGANGYYLQEISSSERGDVEQGREQVLALGPGALWSFSQNTHLFFNLYFEMATHNRPEGEFAVLRLVHHF